MRHFHEARWTIEGVAKWLLWQSSKRVTDGTEASLPILQDCTALHYPTGTQAILTRDTGHHTSGWRKNPDYERCIHLSLCFRDPEMGIPKEKDKKLTAQWIDAIFAGNNRLLWCEPPYSPIGKKRDVWHYQFFRAVYTKEFTERDGSPARSSTSRASRLRCQASKKFANALRRLRPGPE